MNHCRLYNEDCRTWVHTNRINKTRRMDVISTANICTMYLQCTRGLGWEIVWIIVRFLLLTWLGSGNIWLKVSFANFFVCVELNEQKIWTCCYFLLVWPRHIDSRPVWNIRFDLTFFHNIQLSNMNFGLRSWLKLKFVSSVQHLVIKLCALTVWVHTSVCRFRSQPY